MSSKRDSLGFTLLELVLAMMISSLVMGILSVALGFSLRVWERQFDRKTSDMPAMIDLLKWQLASINPAPVQSEMESRIVFQGKEHALTFATDVSVRALSRGVPVVARYLFKPSEKLLYYAEIPFDPYHPEPIEQFMKLEPGKKKTWPVFQATEVLQVVFSFGSGEGALEKQWNEEKEIPAVVGVRWSEREAERKTAVIIPNSFFPRDVEQEAGQAGFDRKRKRQ
ncbi:MAG: type II secretion system protein J [Syntrophobacteraceae bacterium]